MVSVICTACNSSRICAVFFKHRFLIHVFSCLNFRMGQTFSRCVCVGPPEKANNIQEGSNVIQSSLDQLNALTPPALSSGSVLSEAHVNSHHPSFSPLHVPHTSSTLSRPHQPEVVPGLLPAATSSPPRSVSASASFSAHVATASVLASAASAASSVPAVSAVPTHCTAQSAPTVSASQSTLTESRAPFASLFPALRVAAIQEASQPQPSVKVLMRAHDDCMPFRVGDVLELPTLPDSLPERTCFFGHPSV